MRAMRWGAVLSVMLLCVTGCAPEPEPVPEPVPETLSASRAGVLYLEAICPVNAAWDDADLEIDRLRVAAARGGDDTSEFARAMAAVGKASERAARQLKPEDQAWPSSVVDEVEAVRETLRSDVKQAAQVAKLDSDEVLEYRWKGAEATGAAASAARAALELPADPIAACGLWEEDAAESAATDAGDEAESDTPATGAAKGDSGQPKFPSTPTPTPDKK